MAQQDAVYDQIGSAYDEYSEKATLKRGERYSVTQMVGNVQGKRVLDLGCGTGIYTRQWMASGAASALGVDLSAEMVRVARLSEEQTPTGARFEVGDACRLGHLGEFDLVTAVWLFNQAESTQALRQMMQNVAENLKPGARLVAFTTNPDVDWEKADSAKYGLRVLGAEPEDDHIVYRGEFLVDPPVLSVVRGYSREIYERELRSAGFHSVEWCSATVSPEDLTAYGEEYWSAYLENCLGTGIVATR